MVEDVTYVQLDKEAAQIPLGSGGLIAIETFQGSRTPGMIRPIVYIPSDIFSYLNILHPIFYNVIYDSHIL